MMSRWGPLVAGLLLACRGAAAPAPAPPEPANLEAVLARWDHDEHPDLRAVVVRRDGAIIAERYYNGELATGLHDIRSAGKSITSLLAGIAIDRGMISGTDARVEALLPEARQGPIAGATFEDLLTMRAGLAADDDDAASPGNEDRLDDAPDPFAFAFAVPAATRPGERYAYNSLTAYLVGLAVERAAGQHLDELAAQALFAPLGITAWRWQRDRAGHTKGQGNLSLTARDVAKLGELVQNGGTYEGRRVISERWIRDSLAIHVRTADVDPYADGYGYMWYARTHRVDGRDVAVSFASGNGGNKIYVVPAERLVVAITSRAYGRAYGQRRSQAILLAILAALPPAGVAPAMADAAPAPARVTLPRSPDAPARRTTRPLTRDVLARLAAIEHRDFERQDRGATAASIEFRHTTRSRPTLGVTVLIEPCTRCPAMDLAAWQARRNELAQALPPALRDRPDTRLEIGARQVAGATAISIYELGAAFGQDEHGQPTGDYLDAYILDHNDGVNRIRVMASYLDDAVGGVDRLLAIAPPEDLEKLAVAFLSFYLHQWQ